MKELKVMLSPGFSEEEFEDVVSGITFRKGRNIEVYSINIEEHKLSGIQSALRKNILLPYTRETREFVNGTNFAKEQEVKQEEIKQEAPVEEVKEEPVKKHVKHVQQKRF
ncbi:hypothetical protein AAAC51_07935 [Priestia megaterium]